MHEIAVTQISDTQPFSALSAPGRSLVVPPNHLALLEPEKPVHRMVVFSRSEYRFIESDDRTEVVNVGDAAQLERRFRQDGENPDLVMIEGSDFDRCRLDAASWACSIRSWGYRGPIVAAIAAGSTPQYLWDQIEEGPHTYRFRGDPPEWGANTALLKHQSTLSCGYPSTIVPVLLSTMRRGEIVDATATVEALRRAQIEAICVGGLVPDRSGITVNIDRLSSLTAPGALSFDEFLSMAFDRPLEAKLSFADVACGDTRFIETLLALDTTGAIGRALGVEHLKIHPVREPPEERLHGVGSPVLHEFHSHVLSQPEFFQRFHLITCNAPIGAYRVETMEAIAHLAVRQGALILIRLHWDDHGAIHWYAPTLGRYGYDLSGRFDSGPKDYPMTKYIRGRSDDSRLYLFSKARPSFLDRIGAADVRRIELARESPAMMSDVLRFNALRLAHKE